MVCNSCGAAIANDLENCTYCGAQVFPSEISELSNSLQDFLDELREGRNEEIEEEEIRLHEAANNVRQVHRKSSNTIVFLFLGLIASFVFLLFDLV